MVCVRRDDPRSVSPEDGSALDLQLKALERAGCERGFKERGSGARGDRPGLEEARSHLRPGDTLMVWKLDRLGRSVRQLVELVGELEKRGVHFASVTDKIDISSSAGRSSSMSWPRSRRWSGISSGREHPLAFGWRGPRGALAAVALTSLDEYLAAHPHRQDPSSPIFLTAAGRSERLSPKRMDRKDAFAIVRRRAEAAGVSGVSPNSLRASGAARLLASGADPRLVQGILDHSQRSLTRRFDRGSGLLDVRASATCSHELPADEPVNNHFSDFADSKD